MITVAWCWLKCENLTIAGKQMYGSPEVTGRVDHRGLSWSIARRMRCSDTG